MSLRSFNEAKLKMLAQTSVLRRCRKLAPVFVDEFRFDRGAFRVDVVAVTESYLIAIEVKSCRDNLNRLQNQLDRYERSFHKIVLCLDEKFRSKIDNFKLPDSADVVFASKSSVTLHKRGRRRKVIPTSELASLLNDNELIQFLAAEHRVTKTYAMKNYEKLIEKTSQNSIIGAIRSRVEGIQISRAA